MKDMYSRHTTRLPALPDSFWRLCEDVRQGWENMNILLDREWEALKRRDMHAVIKLARAKNDLAARIDGLERKLARTAEVILEACGVDPDDSGLWNTLEGVMCRQDARRLNGWRWKRNAAREMAFAVNRRLYQWISEQIEMTSSLASVVAGRQEPASLTYTSSGRRSADSRPRPSGYLAATGRRADAGRGVSVYRGIQGA